MLEHQLVSHQTYLIRVNSKESCEPYHTSMNPPAMGNMVVTSPTLCMSAHTMNPRVPRLSDNFTEEGNSSSLKRTDNGEPYQGTQRPGIIQGGSKSVKAACANDTRERDERHVPTQESPPQTIVDDDPFLNFYCIGGLFGIILLFRPRGIADHTLKRWRIVAAATCRGRHIVGVSDAPGRSMHARV